MYLEWGVCNGLMFNFEKWGNRELFVGVVI